MKRILAPRLAAQSHVAVVDPRPVVDTPMQCECWLAQMSRASKVSLVEA